MNLARRVPRRPTVIAGTIIVLVFVLLAAFAPLLEPYSVAKTSGEPFDPPSAAHWLGTDQIGKDMLSLTLEGARNSMLVGFAAAFVAIAIGGSLGIVAGYRGGWGETGVAGVTDFFLVIPGLPLMIVIAAIFGQTIYHIVLVIGLLSWMNVTYVVRAQVHTLKERGFVARARSLGAGDHYLIRRHIVPHVAPLLVAQTVLTVATAIFMEAALAFLGLGDPQRVSWGTIIERANQNSAVSTGAWWAIVPPGVCIALVVLGCFLVGQGVEEMMNPRLGHAHVSPRSFRRRLPTVEDER
jgi:peptide/nickel transport system permease protein